MKKLSEVVDRAYDLIHQIKPLSTELDELKTRLKEHGRKYKQSEISGEKATARFAAVPKYSCDAKALYEALKDAGQEELFWDIVNVKVAALKDAMGSTFVDANMTNDPDWWGRVNFIRK